MRVSLCMAALWTVSAPACAVEIDGQINPAEWAGARHITDFRMVQPLTREVGRFPTEAWVLATPDGLAIAFRCGQPTGVPLTRQRSSRDNPGPVDRVGLYVDFDGEGRNGYNFSVTLAGDVVDGVLSNETQFRADWDGDWQHASVDEGDAWSAEMLIPWSIAPMQKRDGDERTIGISLDRVIGATGERMAWPAVSSAETRFISMWSKHAVPQYSRALLAITPYAVAVYDNVARGVDVGAGADIFWKPSGQFQLSATLNPDFGQVESDQLVVNFGAVETFFSDKRPFFTENQSFFEAPLGAIYTRRVGGPADDGAGTGDVTAAVKVNGSFSGANYGLFAATEAGAVGRDFYALRTTHDAEAQGFGAMITHVNRPFLHREATVLAVDHRWTPNEQWTVRTAAVRSNIVQAGVATRGSGVQAQFDQQLGPNWRQQVFATHLEADLELNDISYLDRNNTNFIRYQLTQKITDLPATSPYASHERQYIAASRFDDSGINLSNAAAVVQSSARRDGGNHFWSVEARSRGYDDLITRGNGEVRMPGKLDVSLGRYWPRRDSESWEFYGNVQYTIAGLEGADGGLLRAFFRPSYHVSDALSLFAGLDASRDRDWLLWRGGNLLGSYESNSIFLSAGTTWLIDSKQELRVLLEAISLDAKSRKAYRVAPDGTPVEVSETMPDFALRNLGFQVRYRYELAPLSFLYVAYLRGGSMFEEGGPFDARTQLDDVFRLRDSEQLLVKFSYRFEI